MNSKYLIVFKSLVKKANRIGKKRKNKRIYLTSITGTSEFLKSLSETEPI